MVGFISGATNPLNPLEKFTSSKNVVNKNELVFQKVKNINELELAIKNSSKPVLLDFWASWCVSCKELDLITFKDEEVIKKLQGFTLLKADVTENNDDALCEATIGIAKLFMKSSQADSALYYARKSLLVAEKSGFTKHILSAGDFLFTYYESIRLIDSAYAYQKISVAAKDSLFNQEKVRASQNLGFSEHMRQQEIIETAKIAAEERKNNIQIAALGVFIPVFLGIVLMLSKRNVKPGAMEFMGMLGVLMLFEFIALLIHPYIEKWTHHSPVLMLLILVVVASLLVPLHHKMEHWVKEELSNRRHKLLKPNDHAV